MTKFRAPDYTPVPSGTYAAWFESAEERESERGGYVRWGWRIADGEFAGQMVFGNTSMNFGPQAKSRRWLEAILARRIEPDEEVNPDYLTGEIHLIRVENTAPGSQGRVLGKVADVLGPVNTPDGQNCTIPQGD